MQIYVKFLEYHKHSNKFKSVSLCLIHIFYVHLQIKYKRKYHEYYGHKAIA